MNTEEKLKMIADVVTQAVKDNDGKFGKDELLITESGSWFITGHLAPMLLAYAMTLASDKDT